MYIEGFIDVIIDMVVDDAFEFTEDGILTFEGVPVIHLDLDVDDYIQIDLFDPIKSVNKKLYTQKYVEYYVDERISAKDVNLVTRHIIDASTSIADHAGFEIGIWNTAKLSGMVYKKKQKDGLNEKEMKERGWTKFLLENFYPNNDFLAKNPLKPGYKKQKMRYKFLVETIERTESFQREKQRVSKLGRKCK